MLSSEQSFRCNAHNSFLTVTYVDDRKYQVALDPHKDLVCIRREI